MTADTPALTTIRFDLADLTAFHKNARVGNTDAIMGSLDELGQFRTIVVNKGTHTGRPNEVLAGNHTVYAARMLQWTHLDATVVDVDDVTAAKIVAADNRTNDLATYDDDKLAALLEEIGRDGLAGTGYTIDDYDDLVDTAGLPEPMPMPTADAGGGVAATADSVTWGFLQWRQTRVRVSADEVAALDELHDNYVEVHRTDVGFGNHLARGLGLETTTAPEADTAGDED